MLHFRSTVALKEVFQTQLKRPLTGRSGGVRVSTAAAACSIAIRSDARSPGRGRIFVEWKTLEHITRKHSVRAFCTKGDSHNDPAKDSSAEK